VTQFEVLSTESAAPADRFDLWREHVRRVCGTLDVRSDDHFDNGTIVSGHFGELRMSLISADAHSVRKVRAPADDADGQVYVSTPLRGQVRVFQDGNDVTVSPGELVSFDSTRPYTLASREPMRLAAVRFPHRVVGLTSEGTHRLTAAPWSGRVGVGALVSTTVATLAGQLTELGGAERAPIGNAVRGLITALFAERLTSTRNDPAATRQALLLRIQGYARERLGDRSLTPALLAREHHISLRYLQLLFAEQDLSPAKWLRDERLARCRTDLADARLDYVTVAAIGARWGFGGASHMGRLFHARYGITPNEFRREGRVLESGVV
jgi:AraC-like DNA-binding protein